MKRTQIYLTEKIDYNLSMESGELGITKSELIRRIMDVHYDKKDLYIENEKRRQGK
jgi:hypothetical protein